MGQTWSKGRGGGTMLSSRLRKVHGWPWVSYFLKVLSRSVGGDSGWHTTVTAQLRPEEERQRTSLGFCPCFPGLGCLGVPLAVVIDQASRNGHQTKGTDLSVASLIWSSFSHLSDPEAFCEVKRNNERTIRKSYRQESSGSRWFRSLHRGHAWWLLSPAPAVGTLSPMRKGNNLYMFTVRQGLSPIFQWKFFFFL